jgi:uncharacterized protein (TIGR02646 family)
MHRLNRAHAPTPACLAKFQVNTHTWDDVKTRDKREIRECLIQMQGERCAYCEALVADRGHQIEHFRRKCVGHFPQLTFQWSNLLLCCDQSGCCGHFKDRRGAPYNVNDLIDPTNEEPDDFFWFHESGGIDVRSGCDVTQSRRAKETLRVLNLNGDHGLRQMRARQLKMYQDPNVDMFDELPKWEDADRREYVRGELAATASQPFCTIIRHFLQDLAR